MKTIDLVSNATKTVAGIKDEANKRTPAHNSGEHFAAIIGRAVAHRSPQRDVDAEGCEEDPETEPLRGNRERTRQVVSDDNAPLTDGMPLLLPAATALLASMQTTAAPAEAATGAAGNSPALIPVVGNVGPNAGNVVPNAADASPVANAPASDPSAPANQPLPQPSASPSKGDAAADGISTPTEAPLEPGSPPKPIPIELLKSANAPNAPPAEESATKTVAADAVMQKPLETADTGGTCGAKHSSPMILAEKTRENAEIAEQNLPAVTALSTGEELPHRAAHPVRLDPSVAAAPVSASTTAPVEIASSMINPLRTLERAEDLMALHGLRLRDSGNDSLQVVIKPGDGLHLSLNLQMRGGQVEIEAQVHRGDYDLLKHHWAELQQQLESRGVRLAPLTSNPSSSGAEAQFAQQQKRSRTEPQSTSQEAFAELALPGALTPKPALRALTRHGWESWA